MEKIGVGDLEANEWIKIEMGELFDGCDSFLFKGNRKTIASRMLDHMSLRKYDKFRWYFHNGGKYDFLFFLEEIMYNRSWKYDIIDVHGSLINIRIQTDSISFQLCDSYAMLPESLKKLSIAFDVEHKKLEFDIESGVKQMDKQAVKYLHNDCLALYEVIQKYIEFAGIEKLKLTIASQSLQDFVDMTQAKLDLIQMPEKEEKDFRKNFYVGGRVEVYKGKGDKVRLYDVNSMYGFAMLQPMPCGEMKTVTSYDRTKIGFYSITVTSFPNQYISPLFYKIRKNQTNKLFFVNGKGTYYLDSTTIDFLVKTFGMRFNVNYGYVFHGRDWLFVDYVEKYYKIKRDTSDTAMRAIAKLRLNSLYGKMGQKREVETLTNYIPNETQNFVDVIPELNLVSVLTVSKNKYIMPFLAGYITALARLHHYKLMMKDINSVFYCDTDSIFSESKVLDQYVSKEIGDLSYDGEYKGIFLAPKMYGLKDSDGEYITFKGFDSKDFTFSQLEKSFNTFLKKRTLLLQGKSKVSMLHFRSCLSRKNGIIGDEGKFLKTVMIDKKTETSYDKREIFNDDLYGFDSRPLTQQEVNRNEKIA